MSAVAATALPLSDAERLAWLRLIRSDNVGPITFAQLLARFGSAEAALDGLPALAERAGRRVRIASVADCRREMDAVAAMGGTLLTTADPAYPAPLRHIDGAPPVITVRGDAGALAGPTVAIVGARNASVNGRKFAGMLARRLGESGFAVASGLARGIDGAAHEAALATGTIAAMAGGTNIVYPPEHVGLADRIASTPGSAIVTEMPLGWTPRARDFPRRNRIVSGLSLGVVIIEAAQRSGSLITARLAGEQGRVVFAVPGSPLDPRTEGSNRLLKDGAVLVTDADDIVSVLAPMLDRPPPAPLPFREDGSDPIASEAEDGERRVLLEALGPSPVEIDDIIRHTRLPAATVQLILLELDLAGRLERHPGQRVSLV